MILGRLKFMFINPEVLCVVAFQANARSLRRGSGFWKASIWPGNIKRCNFCSLRTSFVDIVLVLETSKDHSVGNSIELVRALPWCARTYS